MLLAIHFHMLRKTGAMSLYQEGYPLSYIRQMPGHENFGIPLRLPGFQKMSV